MIEPKGGYLKHIYWASPRSRRRGANSEWTNFARVRVLACFGGRVVNFEQYDTLVAVLQETFKVQRSEITAHFTTSKPYLYFAMIEYRARIEVKDYPSWDNLSMDDDTDYDWQ